MATASPRNRLLEYSLTKTVTHTHEYTADPDTGDEAKENQQAKGRHQRGKDEACEVDDEPLACAHRGAVNEFADVHENLSADRAVSM